MILRTAAKIGRIIAFIRGEYVKSIPVKIIVRILEEYIKESLGSELIAAHFRCLPVQPI